MFDPEVSVSDPDNTLDPPIYEGLASLAHTMLKPGVYLAETQPVEPGINFEVKVIVTTNGAESFAVHRHP